jgi:hypothetical protein
MKSGMPSRASEIAMRMAYPFTILWLLGSFLYDLTLLLSGRMNHDSAAWIAQSFAAGGWLAVGRSHRLVRAVTMIAFVAFLASAMGVGGQMGNSPRAAAAIVILAGFTGLFAMLCQVIEARRARRRRQTIDKPVRFRLLELFAWTVVVAIASAALRQSPFLQLIIDDEIVSVVATCATAGLTYALLLGRYPRSIYKFAFVALANVALIMSFSRLSGSSQGREVITWALGILALLALARIVDDWLRAYWFSGDLESPTPLAPASALAHEGDGAVSVE